MIIKRPEKDQYYLDIAKVVATRSTCLKVMMGAIIVKEDQIIASGYVGAPRNTQSSMEHGFCLRKKLNIPSGSQYELCRSVHAEQNAIINAARAGVSLFGGNIYIYGQSRDTHQAINAFPCFICKKMIINCGLNRVITSALDPETHYLTFLVDEWIKEWQQNDIIDDRFQYGKEVELKSKD
jgi:dCMP deaminase